MNEPGPRRRRGGAILLLTAGDITVFHDEIELPPGKVWVKVGGARRHNGLRSITAHVGNDYRRVRIGVGHPGRIWSNIMCLGFRQERARLGRGAD
jgi:PTH1 family peptidyl-tRNA hydrolase